jgi:hypothetical protein
VIQLQGYVGRPALDLLVFTLFGGMKMELIDLYTREVGRKLPEKMRVDIEKEIRSFIEDTLEDEAAVAGRIPDEAMVVDVLKRMGPPEKVATSYLPPRYLIGPELYPHFIKTLRIVLSVVTVLAALAIGVSAGARADAAQSIFEIIGQIIGGLVSTIFQATAIVVLVYAVLQFTESNIKAVEGEWDPRNLRAEPDPEKVKIGETVFETIFTVLALIIFNFYSQWIGISTMQDGQWVHMPVLAPAFFTYLPWLSLSWVLQIGLNMWLSARGAWSQRLRWGSVALSALTVGILAWMLTGPAVIELSLQQYSQFFAELTPEAVQRINEGLYTSVRLIIGLVIAVELLEAGKQLLKLLRDRLPEPLLVK